jgi:hypothetical protein
VSVILQVFKLSLLLLFKSKLLYSFRKTEHIQIVLFLVVLEFEFRASHLLGRYFATRTMTSAFSGCLF